MVPGWFVHALVMPNDLEPGEFALVSNDNLLWLRTLWLMRCAADGNDDVECTIEQPRDPAEWKGDVDLDKMPSFLVWEETQQVITRLRLKKITLDQGALGHASRKPTCLLTRSPELLALDGLSGGPTQEVSWPTELQDRLRFSKSLASWAPGLKDQMAKVIRRISRLPANSTKAVRASSAGELNEWKAHVFNNHVPYRRDCSTCGANRGRAKQHRKVVSPEPYCLSLDLNGPFKPGVDQLVQEPKYFLIGVSIVPVDPQLNAMAEGIQALGGKVSTYGEDAATSFPVPPAEDKLHQDAPSGSPVVASPAVNSDSAEHRAQHVESPALDSDPLPALPADVREDLTDAEVQFCDRQTQMWQEHVASLKSVQVHNLTFAAPVKSRQAKEIVKGVSTIYCGIRSFGLPVVRVHADRAKEFTSAELQNWLRSRDMFMTFTGGDDPAGNGRAEAEIQVLKAHARTAMNASKAPAEFWPLAIRHVSEVRLRSQLAFFGVPTPPVLPFGVSGFAKRKRWDDRSNHWKPPMRRIRVWGPAADMSLFHRGYFVQLPDRRWMRTNLVVRPSDPPAEVDVVRPEHLRDEVPESG